jgi:hypothetical protein
MSNSSLLLRPNYLGPLDGYPNRRAVRDVELGLLPCVPAPTLLEEINSGRARVPKQFHWGAQTILERSYKYAIDAEGNIRVSRVIYALPDYPQYEHHSQLVSGAHMYGAGWLEFDEAARIVAINAMSDHYWPLGVECWGDQFFGYLRYLLEQLGLDTKDIRFKT